MIFWRTWKLSKARQRAPPPTQTTDANGRTVWHIQPYRREGAQILIVCPLCNRVHRHGTGQDGKYEGPRVPHCRDRPPGGGEYVIDRNPDLRNPMLDEDVE